jgi:hypothetical protein
MSIDVAFGAGDTIDFHRMDENRFCLRASLDCQSDELIVHCQVEDLKDIVGQCRAGARHLSLKCLSGVDGDSFLRRCGEFTRFPWLSWSMLSLFKILIVMGSNSCLD